MASNSFLDSIVSFFTSIFSLIVGARLPDFMAILPGFLFSGCEIWLAAVGWKRHRALGFIFFLISGSIGIVWTTLWIIAATNSPGSHYAWQRNNFLLQIAPALSFISGIFGTLGLGHLAYRAKFASPANPEFRHP